MKLFVRYGILVIVIQNKFLKIAQHNFVPNRYPLKNMLYIYYCVFIRLDTRKSIEMGLMDLSKVFVNVDRRLLLVELEALVVSPISCKLIAAFLKKHFSKVRVSADLSPLWLMLSGDLQGSVLGPLLFLIVFSVLPTSSFTLPCDMFADDWTLNFTTNEVNTVLKDLRQTFLWTSDWQMRFNFAISQHLQSGPRLVPTLIMPVETGDFVHRTFRI